jgi:hypothetical protein
VPALAADEGPFSDDALASGAAGPAEIFPSPAGRP